MQLNAYEQSDIFIYLNQAALYSELIYNRSSNGGHTTVHLGPFVHNNLIFQHFVKCFLDQIVLRRVFREYESLRFVLMDI